MKIYPIVLTYQILKWSNFKADCYLVYLFSLLFNDLAFLSFDHERAWCMLFHKRIVRTELDINVFIYHNDTIDDTILPLKHDSMYFNLINGKSYGDGSLIKYQYMLCNRRYFIILPSRYIYLLTP